MFELTNIAISKTKFGTTYYAVIDENRCVVAIFKAKGGYAFQINFIENTPATIAKVDNYISDLERKQAL